MTHMTDMQWAMMILLLVSPFAIALLAVAIVIAIGIAIWKKRKARLAANETIVLSTLAHLGRPAAVPEIAMDMNEVLSDASLYKLLRRLHDHGLVQREDAVIEEVNGRQVRRILWGIPSAKSPNA